MGVLTEQQQAVTDRCLDEECAEREHLVIALTGSHAYGFPSPDSDVDLKGVHVAPTDAILGLSQPRQAHARLEVVDGVEIDYTSNELGQVLAGILSGNGNFLERIVGPHILRTSPELDELTALTRGALSRRMHRHYAGFSRGQAAALEEAETPTAKKLLYVLRTALTGAHLMLTGELVTDLSRNAAEHGFDGVGELIEQKRAGERVPLAAGDRERWHDSVQRAFELLDDAVDRSPLPAEPANRAEVESWLVALRRSR